MRIALVLLGLVTSAALASAQTPPPAPDKAPELAESTGRTVTPETKGQLQPQGWTGPIDTKSEGGAPAESPQGQTPPGMQAAPEGSSKTVVEPDAAASKAVEPNAAPSKTVIEPNAAPSKAVVAPAAAPPLSIRADEAAKDAIGTTAGGAKIPTVEEARAAKMMPDDPNPVPGQISNAVGGVPAETTGVRPADSPPDTRPGPIGATGQTMPSKLSQRNAILDHVPIMAMPLALTEEQRRRIYETVMADKSRQPAPGAESLAPATFLSTEQALNEAQPIPGSLQDIELLKGLQYVKAKDKVLLVTPASRIVIDAITM
jgi:hypothetical protein